LALLSKEAGMRNMGLLAYKMEGLTDKYQVSLRSNGSEDTTAISQLYGGGGHLNASGFSIAATELDNWKI
jgi:nanoRNase/pAp phosphatase (c-di-AMP/oligoRNAs hydrolase)